MDYTLSSWLDYYLNTYSITTLKKSTYDSYESICRNHINPYIGSLKLSELNVQILQNYFNRLFRNGRVKDSKELNPKTVQNVHRVLHKAFKVACIYGVIDKNYTELIQLPKYRKKQMRVLSEVEQAQILKESINTKYGLEICIALTTEMRLGEIVGFQWSDIDFNNNLFYVRHTIKRVKVPQGNNKTSLQISTPKSDSSTRIVPVLPVYIDLIKERKQYSTGLFVFGKKTAVRMIPGK